MTITEITALAERICKARDHDQRDARAMLRQIGLDHGDDALRAVVRQMKRIDTCRRAEAMAVFAGLPNNISFEQAIAIKRERRDPVAQGWTKQIDGSFAKTTRC